VVTTTKQMRAPAPGPGRTRPWRTGAILSAFSLIAVVVGWQVMAMAYDIPVLMPTPVQVVETAGARILDGSLLLNIGASLFRILAGFTLGCVVGAPIGLLMGYFRPVRAILNPYLQFFRSVPPIAWLTPVVLWFGIGEESKVVIITYTTIFVVILNTMVGVSSVSPNKIRAALSLGATRRQVFMHVVTPATLPYVLTGMRLAMGLSFATVVSAEMIAADSGIGFLIFNSRLWGDSATIFLGIIVLGLMGFVVDRLFSSLVRRFAHQYSVRSTNG
jgi:NitT/TauT family transport system permease protein